ncbi:MAG: ABC transporter permease [Chloroflexaceae bacterium]|jgi:ABC-2 type transport system permease protein|nr:ABC transporter permease [Chloroflexaceae bacterium]
MSIVDRQLPTENRQLPAAPRQVIHGWRYFLRTVWARAYPRIIGQQREPAWVFFETFLPFLATVGYVYVYRAMEAPEEFVGFAVMGGAMTAFWLNVMWSMATQLYWDKEQGNLPLYIMSPASLMAILLGMALGGMLATSLRAAIILVLGTWLFQVPFAISNYLQLFAVFLLTMTALYGLGMLFGSLFLLFGRNAWQISQMMQEPIYFISGFYFPIETFGFAVALAAAILPLTLGMDAMRQLTFANGPALGFLSVEIEIGILLLLAVGFVSAAKLALDRMEWRARYEGTLSDRRK